jgi:hypothetical protein
MSRHLARFAAAALVLGAGIAAASSAHAVAPNYQRYCSTHHPGSFVNRLLATGEPVCTLRTYGGYGLMHYRINYGEACRLTNGSFAFRGTGAGVDCTGAANPSGRVLTQNDYQKYCQRTYGNGAMASFSFPRNAWLCTVRTYNGLGLMHYHANIAAACSVNYGTSRFVRLGDNRSFMCVA